MAGTDTKSPTSAATALIAVVLVASAVGLGFRQLWREGVFSETKPIELTQAATQTPSPSRTQGPPQTLSSTQPPQTQSSQQDQSPPQMQPSRQGPASPPGQPRPGIPPQPQAQSTQPQAPPATESKPDSSSDDMDFQMWFEQEMAAAAFEEEMQETAPEEANAPQQAPASTEQTEPNAGQ